MSKVLVFHGQGSQKVGMGKELFDNFSIARNLFEKVDILDIEKITAWAIKNEGSTPTRAKPFYFVPPRVSIPKAK